MGWPQITAIVLMALGAGSSMARDGEPRQPHSAGAALIGTGIWSVLLIAGGFFS